jgi:CHAT domain-containing protein
MLNLIDKGGLKGSRGRVLFPLTHPTFWAPFSLVGDGGEGKPTS